MGGAGGDLKPVGDVTAGAERCGVTAAAVMLGAYEIAALGQLLAASLSDLIRSQQIPHCTGQIMTQRHDGLFQRRLNRLLRDLWVRRDVSDVNLMFPNRPWSFEANVS